MKGFFIKLGQKIYFYIKFLLLSPGVIVHELAHWLFCIIFDVKVYKVKLFRFSEIAGYVEHEEATNIFSAFFVSFGPLFLNSFIAFVLFQQFDLDFLDYKKMLFLYLGISIALSAIPSDEDGNVFGNYIKHKVKSNFLFFPLFIFFPLTWILKFANFLKKIYFDYIFTFIIFYLALFVFKK